MAELAAPIEADVKIEVLDLPVKKTLGLFGGTPAKVRAYYEYAEQGDVEQYLGNILKALGLEPEILITEEEESLQIQINCGDNYGAAIGRRGETLDAIQYLTRLVINKGEKQYQRISINIGDYRQKRENTLRALAKKNAERVKKYGRNVVLDPMNPFERRIIHTTIQEIEGVESHSVGSDENRKVIITPVGGETRGGYRGNNREGSSREGGFRENNREGGGYRDRGHGGSGGGDRRGGSRPPQRPRSDAPASRPPRSDVDFDGSRYGKIQAKDEPDNSAE